MDEPRRCTATTKKGTPCPNRPLTDQTVCVSHSEHAQANAHRAAAASVQARKDTLTRRQEASEDAKLTLTERLNRAAAARATELVNALVERAIDGDMRAQGLVWDRVEGKVADHLITEAGDPFEMSEAQLAQWLVEPAQPSTDFVTPPESA